MPFINANRESFNNIVSIHTKQMFFILSFVFAMAAWCTPSFAVRQSIVGAVSTPLNADGEVDGVSMTAQGGGGELTVGAQDINTVNGTLATTAVSTDVSGFSRIIFNGNSTVNGDIGAAGLIFNIIDVNDAVTTVNFQGTVFTTTMDIGVATVNFNSGTLTNVGATNFTDDGTLNLATNTRLTGALTTATANTGTLTLASGSILNGAVGGANGISSVNVVGGNNIAGVTGTITGRVETNSISLLTNTLSLGGALELHATGLGNAGIINTTIASQTVFGNISSAGGAFEPGATIGVNVLVPGTSVLVVGTTWNIVDMASSPGGSIVTVSIQNPTNPLYTFAPVPLAGTAADGLLTIQLIGTPLSTAPPTLSAASVLLAIPQSDILAPIGALTDAGAVANAVEQLSPLDPSLAAPLVTFEVAREFQNLWLSRLDMCSQFGQPEDNEDPSCSANDPSHGWWVKGFGKFGEQDAYRDFTGYDSRSLGTMIAYDVPLGLHTRTGLGFGYARSSIQAKKHDTGVTFHTYQGTAYIGHEQGAWFVDGSASFGWNQYSGRRHIEFPGVDRTADSDYGGQAYTGLASTGYHLSAPKKFVITPLASLQYSRVEINDYEEKNAGDINLRVDHQSYNYLESGLGVSLERAFHYGGGTFIPETHFKWLHMLNNARSEQTTAFTSGGPSFGTKGPKLAAETFNVGGGLNVLSCNCGWRRFTISAVYDFFWRNDNYNSHEGTIKFTHRF